MQKNKPDYYNDLDKVYLKIWDLLKIGLQKRDLPFHIPVFICGEKGNFNGEAIVKMVANHPATANFICKRLYLYFASEEINDADESVNTEDMKDGE